MLYHTLTAHVLQGLERFFIPLPVSKRIILYVLIS